MLLQEAITEGGYYTGNEVGLTRMIYFLLHVELVKTKRLFLICIAFRLFAVFL